MTCDCEEVRRLRSLVAWYRYHNHAVCELIRIEALAMRVAYIQQLASEYETATNTLETITATMDPICRRCLVSQEKRDK